MTPEQEEQMARALAETARHEPVPPVPAEVAARLDHVLADLVASRATADGTQTPGAPSDAGGDDGASNGARNGARNGVSDAGGNGASTGSSLDEVAARRRRRRPQLLTAAAAVAVVVAAGAAVVTGGLGTTSSTESSTSAGSDAGEAKDSRESAPSAVEDPPRPAAGVPRLRTSTLTRDVQRLLAAGPQDAGRRKALTGPPGASGACLTPPVRPGERLFVVRLDGRPGTLVLGTARAGARQARVYSCTDGTRPVASAAVPLG